MTGESQLRWNECDEAVAYSRCRCRAGRLGARGGRGPGPRRELGDLPARIRVGDLLGFDEAYHSLWGLLIADDLLHARFVSILVDTNRQVLWPPLHSWYLALLFIVFGPSAVVARSSSLLAFVATAVIVYFTGRRLTGSAGPGRTSVGGVVASACLIASGGVQTMASAAMLELPALFWLAVSFWLYLRCRSTGASERWPPILLGLAVLATYLTRTSYGVLIALALTVASLVDGRWLSRRRSAAPSDDEAQLASRRHGQLLTALALGVPLAAWLAYPGKIGSTLIHLINAPHGPERFSVEGLLFYPRAMLWLAGSWPLLVVWMLALVLTLRPRVLASNAGLRLVVVFLALQMLFAELAVNKAERYSLPLALGLSLLAGFWAGRCWIWLEEGRFLSLRPRLPSLAGWVVAAGVAVLLAWQVYGVEVSGKRRGNELRWGPLLEHLVADLRRNGPCLLVVSTDPRVSAAGIDWHLAAAGLLPMEGAGALVTPDRSVFRPLPARSPAYASAGFPSRAGRPLARLRGDVHRLRGLAHRRARVGDIFSVELRRTSGGAARPPPHGSRAGHPPGRVVAHA